MNARYFGAFVISLALSVSAAAPAAAALTDPVATIHQFIDGMNKGDMKAAMAACAEQTGIIDEFPPHAWMSCTAWLNAFGAASKAAGDTDEIVTLRQPLHDDITGNVAYVVLPAVYAYKEKGKPMSENATLTVVLKQTAGAWHITAWSWGKL